MGRTSSEKVKVRQSQIIEQLRKPSGATGTELAAKYGVTKGTILKDIAALRRQGYPIQVSSMVSGRGLIEAVYEIPKYLK